MEFAVLALPSPPRCCVNLIEWQQLQFETVLALSILSSVGKGDAILHCIIRRCGSISRFDSGRPASKLVKPLPRAGYGPTCPHFQHIRHPCR